MIHTLRASMHTFAEDLPRERIETWNCYFHFSLEKKKSLIHICLANILISDSMSHSVAYVCGYARWHTHFRQVEIMMIALLSMSVLSVVCERSTMYDVLGLEPSATAQDIKKSYRGWLFLKVFTFEFHYAILGMLTPTPAFRNRSRPKMAPRQMVF